MLNPISNRFSPSPGSSDVIEVSSEDVGCGDAPTPAIRRDLYRTCIEDDIRKTPYSRNDENEMSLVGHRDISIQAFNTPHPQKLIGIPSKLVPFELDSEPSCNSKQPQTSSQSTNTSLPPFQIAALELPKHFRPSLVPINVVEEEDDNFAPQDAASKILEHRDEQELSVVERPVEVEVAVREEEEPIEEETPLQPVFEEPLTVSVEFASWALLPTKKFSGFFLAGKNVTSKKSANTSRIVDRVDLLTVKSTSGAVIRLVGPPDHKRMLKFYLSRSFVSLFSKGFPNDWSSLFESEINRLQRASEGVKNQIVKLLQDEIMQITTPMSHSFASSTTLGTIATNVSAVPSSTSLATLNSGGTIRKHRKSEFFREEKVDRLAPIIESETPVLEPIDLRHFPIETFTPKLCGNNEPFEDEDDEGLDSSSSMAESKDLSEVEHEIARRHYQRRWARQGNKPAAKLTKATEKQISTKPVKGGEVEKKKNVKKPPVSKTKAPALKSKESLSTDFGLPSKAANKRARLLPPSNASNPFDSGSSVKMTRKRPEKVADKQAYLLPSSNAPSLGSGSSAKMTRKRHEKLAQPVLPQKKDVLIKTTKKAAAKKEESPQTKRLDADKIDEYDLNGEFEEVKKKKGRSKHTKDMETKPEVAATRKTRSAAAKKTLPQTQPSPLKLRRGRPRKDTAQEAEKKSNVTKKAKVDQYDLDVVLEDERKKPVKKTKPANPVSPVKSPTPTKQPNPLKVIPTDNVKAKNARGWSEGEIQRLKRALLQVPTNEDNYWGAVANLVATRSEDECFNIYNKRMDIQKSTHCDMMFERFMPGNVPSASFSSPEMPAKAAGKKANKKKTEVETSKAAKPTGGGRVTKASSNNDRRVITAKAGTQKRREQIRAIVEKDAQEEWYNKPVADAMSNYNGGLTQSERDALIGGNAALVTPSAAAGTLSMVTAGGQALSGIYSGDSNNAVSMISSALGLPKDKDRQEADKLVTRLRGASKAKVAGLAKAAKKPQQAVRKKAIGFDHLSPMVGENLKGFMPKDMSTPNIPAALRREIEDDDDDTLMLDDNNGATKDFPSPIRRK